MLLLIDNYDSFTYNIVQYLAQLGQEVAVYRNDEIDCAKIAEISPQYLVIGPGPCAPSAAGISLSAIRTFAGKIPILGICLGHQAIGEAFGGKVVCAQTLMHGKNSLVHHNGRGMFAGVPNPVSCTRYHSLSVERSSLPGSLKISAWTDDGEIMGLRHHTMPIESVQFHPEALLTEHGLTMLQNFLNEFKHINA